MSKIDKAVAFVMEATTEEKPYVTWGFSDDFHEWDEDESQDQWEYVVEDLTELIRELNPDGDWHAEVSGFGWRGQSGEKDFNATDGLTLLRELLPDTDNLFKVFVDRDAKEIRIQNYHHDAPTGNEWYTLTPQEPEDEEDYE